MNGAHDMGGMQAFGPVRPEAAEPTFHAAWEARVLAMALAMGATRQWNLDMTRAARESLPPAQYLASSYYQIWFEGLKKMLVTTGLATAEEIESGKLVMAPAAIPGILRADQVATALARGSPVNRQVAGDAAFGVGDMVRARQIHPLTHTRLPRYCRGKRGQIVAVHGAHVFPDANAIGLGEQAQWLYSVRFEASALWGADTTASSVYVDCWEPYLEKDNG